MSFVPALVALFAIGSEAHAVQLQQPTQRDHDVLQALMTAVLRDKNLNINGNESVLLCKLSPSRSGFLLCYPFLPSTVAGHKLPADAVSDFNARNDLYSDGQRHKDKSRFDYSSFKLPQGVVLTSIEGSRLEGWLDIPSGVKPPGDEAPINPNGNSWFEAYVPGYSRDGSIAVVSGPFGPALGMATLDAVLKKRHGRWVMTWHRLDFTESY
jgi:hypothetical protein